MINNFKNFIYIYKYYIIAFLISCFYWLYIKNYWGNIFMPGVFRSYNIIYPVVSFILIILAGESICFIYCKTKQNDFFFRTFTKSLIIFMIINFIVYFLTQHGVFNGDELSCAANAKNCRVDRWFYLHPFTIIYFILSYLIFPFLSGVVIIQILIFSLISSYIFSKFYCTLDFKDKWLLFIPFILPAILRANIQPLRSNIYYIFFILLFALIYFKYKEQKEVSYYDIFLYGFFGVIVTCWRAENTVLILLLPVLLKFIFDKKISWKKIFIFSLVFIIPSFLINYKKDLMSYKLLPIQRPLTVILKTDFKTNNRAKDIEVISNAIDIKKYTEISNMDEIVFASFPSENFSDENYNKLLLVYIKLVIYNYKTFLKDRMAIYNGFSNCKFLREYIHQYSNKNTLKGKTLNILEGRNSNYEYTIFTKIIYCYEFILAVLLVTLIMSIKKRDRALMSIAFLSLFLGFLIYVTSAEAFFHYYTHMYLLGCIIFTYFIMYLINRLIAKHN